MPRCRVSGVESSLLRRRVRWRTDDVVRYRQAGDFERITLCGGSEMRLDIYRRPEHDGIFSYLAVPEVKPIPQEAISTDWIPAAKAVEVDDDTQTLPDFHIEGLRQ